MRFNDLPADHDAEEALHALSLPHYLDNVAEDLDGTIDSADILNAADLLEVLA